MTTRRRPRWPPAVPRSKPSARSPRARPPDGRSAGNARPGDRAADPVTARHLARLYDLDLVDDPATSTCGPSPTATAPPRARCRDGPSVPLAGAGHEVTAVDIDPAMLTRAAIGLPTPARPRCRQARRGRPPRAPCPATPARARVHRAELDHAARDPRPPSGRPSGRSRPIFGRVASPPSMRGCRTPTTGPFRRPRSTNGSARIRRRRLVTKTGSAVHDASNGTIVPTVVFDQAAQARLRDAGSARTPAPHVGRRARVLRRGGRARGGDACRRLRPGAARAGSERAVLIAERR